MPTWFSDSPRFWSKVAVCVHGLDCHACCWLWKAKRHPLGYGRYCFTRTEQIPAHRHAWELFYACFMPPELFALHTCNIPPCASPHHAYPGTQTTNMQQCRREKRMSVGSQHYNAKLTESAVSELRQLNKKGWSEERLARRYSVHQGTIHSALHYISWKHVP